MSTVAFPFEHDILAAQRGDRRAFSRLVDAYSGVVSAITLAIVRDVATSEDVAQNVFLAAWSSLRQLRNPASFLPWLRQLARNQSKQLVRSRSRFARRHQPWPADAPPEVADDAASARELLVAREEETALLEAWDRLPNETHELLTLYYREGRSVRQVADLLELREDVVKKRLERARALLKDTVLERFEDAVRKTAPGAAFTAAVVAAIAAAPGTAHAAATATTAVAAKNLAGGGALAKLSAALGSHAFVLTTVFCLLASIAGLLSWLVVHPNPDTSTARATATGNAAAASSAEAALKPSSLPRAMRDRAKRDELRAKLLAAYAAAAAEAPSSASAPPAAVERGQRQTNDIEEFGRFVTQAIREDFIPMAKSCANELSARRPDVNGKALVAFELLGDDKLGGVVNSAEIVRDKSTLVDDAFETCVRESLYGVYFDPPPGSARATLNFEVAVRGGDGGIDENVEEFHLKDRRGEPPLPRPSR